MATYNADAIRGKAGMEGLRPTTDGGKERSMKAPTYDQIMYDKILTHANCVVAQESLATGEEFDECAIVITNYHDGANVAIECQKCNEVIIDFNKPGGDW